MKKIIYKALFISTLSILFAACVENNPTIEKFPGDKIAFTYNVVGDYALDYLVGSTIQFTNTSAASGNCSWDFGDGQQTTGDAPQHAFQTAGVYDVKLTVTGQGEIVQRLMISDIRPILSFTTSDQICEVNTSTVSLHVYLPNPESLQEEYQWTFPAGTTDVNGNPLTTSNLKDPGLLKFKNVGSQKVTLDVKLGGRLLEEGTVNVQVGYNQPVKTIYYAVKGGNLMALKVVPNPPAGTTIAPFDLGVKSGQHPFNILFNDSIVYVLDAGQQYYYIDDTKFMNMGDGKISAISKDGKVVETVGDNIGGFAFDDPFFGYIDAASSILYFSDRNTGISKIGLNQRNQKLDRKSSYPYWVQNATLGYYGNPIAYGAINANFTKVGDTWWWGKYSLSYGIYRFKDSDILPAMIATGTGTPPASGAVLTTFPIKSFVVDQKNGVVYIAVPSGADAGFYKVALSVLADVANPITDAQFRADRILALPGDTEGSSSEPIYICQMVLDSDDGSVYFGYRAGPGTTEVSGLKRYNPATNKIETILSNVDIYGITINDKKTKLF